MKVMKAVLSGVVGISLMALPRTAALGELQWQMARMEPLRLRLVALAWNHPPSSFGDNEEIFVAEMQISKDESRLVKLVYYYLGYQPALSDNGLDYATVHELRAARDPQCDETLGEIATGRVGDWRQEPPKLKYSTDAPTLKLSRHKKRLPCYVTSASDYTKPVHEPASEP
ncbi:MAG: hypothetical protein ACRD3Q_04170 [Terriglobales bacterium]